jgi:hypothetical protein
MNGRWDFVPAYGIFANRCANRSIQNNRRGQQNSAAERQFRRSARQNACGIRAGRVTMNRRKVPEAHLLFQDGAA